MARKAEEAKKAEEERKAILAKAEAKKKSKIGRNNQNLGLKTEFDGTFKKQAFVSKNLNQDSNLSLP